MPLSADCENCFQPYTNLPDTAAGKTFKCKACGHPVKVSRPGSGPANGPLQTAPLAGARKPTGSKRPTRNSSEGSPLVIVGIVVGGLACLAVAWLLISPLISGGDADTNVAVTADDDSEVASPNESDVYTETVESPTSGAGVAAMHGAEPVADVSIDDEGSPSATQLVQAEPDSSAPQSSVQAASRDAERVRPALIEALNQHEKAQYIATLIKAMNRDELAGIADQLVLTIPLRVSTALMMVPTGFDLNDDNTLIERQKLVVKNLSKRDETKPYAGPVERMTIDEYREWEREKCGPQLESVRDALTRPVTGIPGLKREQITFNENGYQLPAGIRERVMEALRQQVERGLETADKKKVDYGNLPFWAPMEVTAPSVPVSWDVSLKGQPSIPNDPNNYITSTIPSPYLAGGLTGFNSGQLRAFDIRTGKSIGELGVPVDNGTLLISPDGRHVINNKIQNEVGKEFPVYSLESGQLVQTIESPTAKVVTWAGIVSSNRFVTFESAERSSTEPNKIRVYDIDKGELLREFAYDNVVFDKMLAVSPDGRYIARMTHGFEIDLFDLEAGRPIATKKMDRQNGLNLETIAFSHAGDKLALLGREIYKRTYVLILDSASGRTLNEFWLSGDFSQYVQNHASYKGRDLAWFPDDSALWIAGSAVVDIEREIELMRYVPKSAHSTIDSFVCNGLRVPANNGVVVLDGYQQGNLDFLPIDFASLRELADAEEDSLMLAAGREVSVDVAFKGVDVPDGGIEVLESALAEALEAKGFTVVEDAPMLFRLMPGKAEKRPGASRSLPTSWSFDVAWVERRGSKVHWQSSVKAQLLTAARSAAGGNTSAVESVARQLSKELKEMLVPTTISADGKTTLPAIGELGLASSRRRK